MGLIAVTGATGQVGGRVARGLSAAGAPQRLVVRDPGRAPDLDGADVRVATYDDGEALRHAFDGADVLLFVSGAEHADRLAQHRTVVEAAAAAGVRRVVYTSFLGASPTSTFTFARDHAATEDLLTAARFTTTFLRDNFYLDVLPEFVGDGALRGPAGTGRVSAVARADVAEVALAAVLDEAHGGRSYDLTGPEALSFAEVAATIARVRGIPVEFVDESVEEAYASRSASGAPRWMVDGWVSTYTAIAAGELEAVSDAVREVTGREPRSLEDVLSSG
ncbi:SDR family oxidoreductase [Kineococcus sp. DHX-1]|uniref:SDR family oxidoreductase n=1 Tax=Kineococcus sp. DHX-1 TaxID=3349638 RepID=UPI0036D3A659